MTGNILPVPIEDNERLAVVEALLKLVIENQEKANDEAREYRHSQASAQMVTDRRIETVERAVCGDPANGEPPLKTRVKNIETILGNAKVTWKTLAFIGSGVVALASFIAWLVSMFGLPKILSPH